MLERWYAGIGSRDAPPNILEQIQTLAAELSTNGWSLRSGGARGVDKAFELGSSKTVIYRPHQATKDAIAIASKLHPAWHMCDEYAQRLHGRNVLIILGSDLSSPVDVVAFWTQTPRGKGGTWMGVRIAEAYDIRTIALFEIPVHDWYSSFDLRNEAGSAQNNGG